MYGLASPCRYADSDVKIMMTQIAGPTLWKSQITSYMGEGFTEEDLVGKRSGDIRAIRYIQWTVENQQEALRQQAKACHDVGMEFHFSIRANLFFHNDSSKIGDNVEKYMNGRWWQENPDARRYTGAPGSWLRERETRVFCLPLPGGNGQFSYRRHQF